MGTWTRQSTGMRRAFGVGVLGLSTLLLVSCGGGSDKDKTPTATTAAVVAPTEVATEPPTEVPTELPASPTAAAGT
ncbi:MAG TPA: hypothetical protein VNP95_01840, partial [Thermomicrobiales bacterium]|nr:hypothetical protein [Thermomicrobiales bacterium]